MPLTKRQFELGVYDETESLKYLVYELLSRNKHLAYSEGELLEMYKGNRESRVDQFPPRFGRTHRHGSTRVTEDRWDTLLRVS